MNTPAKITPDSPRPFIRQTITRLFPTFAAAAFGTQLYVLGFDAVFVPAVVLFAAVRGICAILR